MSLILSGTDGLSDVDGSAATPAIRGTDANTGIFFPAADTIAFSEGGVEAARINSAGAVLVNTTSATGSTRMVVADATGNGQIRAIHSTGLGLNINQASASGAAFIQQQDNADLGFSTNNSERMRIDSSGNLLVGKTTSIASGRVTIKSATTQHLGEWQVGTDGYGNLMYNAAGTNVGAINIASASTSYVTTSDYRLKEDVIPMIGALAKVAQLKPVTYKWKADGSNSQGFIAHELQAIVPECVVGEKDAVNEDGSIKPQGIDTSFLVATLTAAIQEQQALITSLTARITALETP